MKLCFDNKRLTALAMALLLVVWLPVPVRAAPLEMRKVSVGVAVARDFKQTPEWKSIFKKRLRYASSIFEREFHIKLAQVKFWDWNPPAENMDARGLLNDIMRRFKLSDKKVDIIIGLTRLTDISGSMNMQDLDVLGLARPFSGYMVLRYPNNPLFRVQEETILVHELGHLFGAIHTNEPNTIMSPFVDKQIPTSFDPLNREIMSVTRGYDFRRGTEGLDAAVVQRLLGAYNRMQGYKQSPEFHYALARFYLTLGQQENAIRSFEQMAKVDPSDGRIDHQIGVLYARIGQLERARKSLVDAVSKLNAEGEKSDLAQAYNDLAQVYYNERNYEGAQYAWSKALALDPGNRDIRVNLAIIQVKRGQVTAGERELQKALRDDPANPRILTHLGLAAQLKKEFPLAEEYLQKALVVLRKRDQDGLATSDDHRQMAELLGGLGLTYWQMGRREDSARYFNMACQKDKSLACRENLGKIYYQISNWDQAIPLLAEVAREKKDDPEIYGLLGVALTQVGQFQNALGVFQEGLRFAKDAATASRLHSNSGQVYMQMRHADPALTEFMAAITKDWNNIQGHMGLAMANLIKGQAVEAKRSLKTVLGMDPGNEQAKSLLVQANQIIEQMRQQQMQNQQMTFQFTQKQ